MKEEKILFNTGLIGKKKEEAINELNELLKSGFIIDTINCEHCDSYDVEAQLRIYLKKE